MLTSSAEKTTPFDATITSGPENPYLDDQPIYADIAAELAAQGVDLNRLAGETSQILSLIHIEMCIRDSPRPMFNMSCNSLI